MDVRDFDFDDHLAVPLVLHMDRMCRYCHWTWNKCIHYGAKNPTYKWRDLEEQLEHFTQDIILRHFKRIVNRLESNPEGTPILYLATSMRHARLPANMTLKQLGRNGRVENKTTFPIEKFRDRKEVTTIPLMPFNLISSGRSDWSVASNHMIKVFEMIRSRFGNKSLEIHTFIASDLIHVYSYMDARNSYLQNYKDLGCSEWIFYDRVFDNQLSDGVESPKTQGYQILPAFTPMLSDFLSNSIQLNATKDSTEQE
jgi:hypothetical protein